MKRIVCIGNRYFGGTVDDVGPRVFDALAERGVPAGIELVDGGLGGLGLLRWFDDARRLVFVDAVAGFGPAGSVHVVQGATVASWAQGGYDHAAGLPYLLRMAPAVVGDERMPQVTVVGVEAPADAGAVRRAADCALRLAAEDVDERAVCARGVA